MKTRVPALCLAIVAIAAALIAVSLHRSRLAAERTRALTEQRRRALAELETRRGAPPTNAVRDGVGNVPVVRPAPAGAGSAAAAARKGNPFRHLAEDPALQAQYFAARRANLRFEYGPLYRELGLTPDQIRQFEDLVMKREEAVFDIASTVPAAVQAMQVDGRPDSRHPLRISADAAQMMAQSGNADVQGAGNLLQQADDAYASGISQLLGPDAAGKVAAFDRSGPARDMLTAVGAQLAAGPDPLTPEQTSRLSGILTQNMSSGNSLNTLGLGRVDWDKALAQAATVLSPAQLAALQALAAPQQTAKAVQQALARSGAF